MPLDHSAAKIQQPVVLRDAPGADHVLTAEALAFIAELQARFGLRRQSAVVARQRRQERIDRGELPDFLPETRDIRQGIWQAAPVPDVLADRRVEITGPVDRKMMINALNSGAQVFMADFEDATSPTFANIIAGHANMLDYRDGTLEFEDPKTGKSYRVGANPALLITRPRGLHMLESNVLIGGQPVSAALFDFGLSIFHCGRALAASGRGPFYYLPKLESHREARFWNDVFLFAQERVGLAPGTIKATVLIETLPAAFEMDEIVWELRDHIAGLNCGRWDYIFSYIKTLRNHPAYLLPDRAEVTMDRAFLATYAARLVKVCHRRGIHAMGGMAAAIPVRNDAAANEAAFAKVRADKQREIELGHDGTWVAHPDLVPVARAIFDAAMPGLNQIRRPRQDYRIEPAKLLSPHQGQVTEAGIRSNISVAIEYLAQWLQGRGAVPINHLMEDAATAEISRAQLWQWRRHNAPVVLADGKEGRLTDEWFGILVQDEIVRILDRLGPNGFHRGHYASAARIVQEAVMAEVLPDFITTPACQVLNALD
ncbi:malate synthase A (plasmid) [Paracoccus methylovorus]|uniref:Malate synthase n=1 Tax=Paracoccus methylovorus TaxID=2812658 RepID=A0ABX7JJ98_9RHOB|nr:MULTISPECIES: malate synthase A [Paracoccus]QRZ14297.1 malate synthase A [Paracoccus methylovorus]